MGRKMISVDQIIANGNKSHLTEEEIEKRKLQEQELKKLGKDKIRPPTFLDKKAKKIFKDIVKELEVCEILANVDIYNLAILSNAIDKYIEATQRLNTDSLTIEYTNKNGSTGMQKNPLVNIQMDYADLIRKTSNDFGLTPSARLKIIQQNAPEPSEEEKQFEEDFGDV